ncbi:hypothetical protein B0I35DRAFT_493425 [Stachybotrys elegans]|uniref:T6SS Phospholipase effector Tle1-like catalytic domain-containing protein n=1 Tax=Stachybotrys elegans TaxID=80388 RepID=A0A8K0WUG6_9HYPO|nr:hypothetical protein B0I35DRAFT_493425 [Stachybotrys elegans]
MFQNRRRHANYKRLILCSDGTWLSSDDGDKSVPSNVSKLARAISKTGLDREGRLVKQIVYYQSGLGSKDLLVQKSLYGAIGLGLDEEVFQLYDFISNNYEPGDELFFFGFSRGAFTVRSAAGLVSDVGVFPAVHMQRLPEMWRAYRQNRWGVSFRNSTWYLDNKEQLGLRDVTIKVIGVWDTVGALGIPDWPLVALANKIGIGINQQYAFHNTRLSGFVEHAFQALAIDEQRLPFTPTLWHQTENGTTSLQQCWFPGVHTNIGGQAEFFRSLGDHEEIGDNTLAWMMDNLSEMLTFDLDTIRFIIAKHKRALNRIDNSVERLSNGWGCGPIVSNFFGLQGFFFWLLGKQDRTPGNYPRDSGDGTAGATNEYFHPMVRIRKLKLSCRYNPEALQGYVLVEPHGDVGWTWAKSDKAVPEYMLRRRPMSVAFMEHERLQFGSTESLSRILCPRDILEGLDSANRMVGR